MQHFQGQLTAVGFDVSQVKRALFNLGMQLRVCVFCFSHGNCCWVFYSRVRVAVDCFNLLSIRHVVLGMQRLHLSALY